MNRFVSAVAVILFASLAPAMALAQDGMPAEHNSGGLGFHDFDAPIGVRWWLANQKVGIDLGIGFSSENAAFEGFPDDNTSTLAFDVGVPIVMKSWQRVHVLFRPGFFYMKEEEVEPGLTPGVDPFATFDVKTMRISGEIEAEVFLMDNFSVSASHGIAYQSLEVEGIDDKQTGFGTFGNDFTEIGFHAYLFGGGGH